MPCGCFGNKKKIKHEKLEDINNEKSALPIGTQPGKEGNDDPAKTAKRRDVVASHYGDQCALLGYRDTGSRPPSSVVDSPQNSHTPSTAPLLSSSRPSSDGGSPTNSRPGALSRSELEEKRREFFSDLSPYENHRIAFTTSSSMTEPSFNTLPTQTKAKAFGEVKPPRPVSQPLGGSVSLEGDAASIPPGPHLLHATPPAPPPLPATDGEGFASHAFISELRSVSDGISKRWANEPTEVEDSPSGLKMREWTKGETYDDDWVVLPEEALGSPLDGSYTFAPSIKQEPPRDLKIMKIDASYESRPSESSIPSTLVTPPSPPIGFMETSISSTVSQSQATNDSGIDEQDEQMPTESGIGWSNGAETSFEAPVVSVQPVSNIQYEQEVHSSVLTDLEAAPEFEVNANIVPIIEETTILNFNSDKFVERSSVPRVEFTSQVSDPVESRIPTVQEIADDFVEIVNKPVPILTQHTSYTVTEPDDLSDRVSGEYGNVCDIAEEFSENFSEVPVKVSEQVYHVREEFSDDLGNVRVQSSKLVQHITEEVVDQFDNISEKVYKIDEPSTEFMEIPAGSQSSHVEVTSEIKIEPDVKHVTEEFVSNQYNELKNRISEEKEHFETDFSKTSVNIEQFGSDLIENGNHFIESSNVQVTDPFDLLTGALTSDDHAPVSVQVTKTFESVTVKEPAFSIESDLGEKDFEPLPMDHSKEIIVESTESNILELAPVKIEFSSETLEQNLLGGEVSLEFDPLAKASDIEATTTKSEVVVQSEVSIPTLEASVVTAKEDEVFERKELESQVSTNESLVESVTNEAEDQASRETRGSVSDESPTGESPNSGNEEESSISVSESSTPNPKQPGKNGKRAKRRKNKK